MSGIYRQPTVIAGVTFVLVMAIAGVFAPILSLRNPNTTNASAFACPPFSCEQGGRSYVLGTDHLGRDVLSRIVNSFRTNLYIGILGTLLGLSAAWLLVILRNIREVSHAPDAPRSLFGIPLWGLAIFTCYIAFLPSLIVIAAVGTSLVLAIVCVGVFASLLPMTLLYDTVQGDGAPSNPVVLVMRRGLTLAPLSFSLAFLMGLFIGFYLTFLGVGVPPDVPSLGSMVAGASSEIAAWWWMVVFPFGIGLVAAGAFSGIVFPVSRALSSHASATGADALNALEITPARFGIRFAAQLIDLAIVLAAVIVHTVLTAIMELPSAIDTAFVVALIVIIITALALSPGKRAVGLRVLRLDGSPAGWGRKLFRYLVSLSTIYIIDLLMIVLRKDRRTLPDLICGTVVVRARVPTNLNQTQNGRFC